jgi:hypothetical protein
VCVKLGRSVEIAGCTHSQRKRRVPYIGGRGSSPTRIRRALSSSPSHLNSSASSNTTRQRLMLRWPNGRILRDREARWLVVRNGRGWSGPSPIDCPACGRPCKGRGQACLVAQSLRTAVALPPCTSETFDEDCGLWV